MVIELDTLGTLLQGIVDLQRPVSSKSLPRDVSGEAFIHETAVVGPDVTLEGEVVIGPFCVVIGNVFIGRGTVLMGHVSIGHQAQHRTPHKPTGSIVIGKNCTFREYSTVHMPFEEMGETRIGDNCYLMAYSHVSHDTVLEDNVTLCNGVQIGGHSTIMEGTQIGLNSTVAQRSVVGPYCYFGSQSNIHGEVRPFGKHIKDRRVGENTVGLERAGLSETDKKNLSERFEATLRCHDPSL